MSVVVTSFSPAGAAEYGLRMVTAFRRQSDLPLVVYLDDSATIAGVETRSTSGIPEYLETSRRLPRTREGAKHSTYYKWDARRFAVKPFVWLDAAERLERGILTWLDGDTKAIAPIPAGLPEELLGSADVAFLGRRGMHPETGYVGFRIPEALPLLRWCRDAYTSGLVLELDGWTDCHVLRAGLAAVPVRALDLTSHLYEGKSHIWPRSPLAPYLDHYKGAQKRRRAA